MSTLVLLVEDDTYYLKTVAIYLRLMGVQVEQAHDGFEALQKLDHNTFDIVVTDLRMPGLNGLDLAKYIRKKLYGIPVVLMTGDPTLPPLSALNESDVFSLLVKPFLPNELMKIIHRAVGDRELQRLHRYYYSASSSTGLIAPRSLACFIPRLYNSRHFTPGAKMKIENGQRLSYRAQWIIGIDGGPISVEESFDPERSTKTRVKRKHYKVIIRLSKALKLLPDSFWQLLRVLIAQLDLDNLIDW